MSQATQRPDRPLPYEFFESYVRSFAELRSLYLTDVSLVSSWNAINEKLEASPIQISQSQTKAFLIEAHTELLDHDPESKVTFITLFSRFHEIRRKWIADHNLQPKSLPPAMDEAAAEAASVSTDPTEAQVSKKIQAALSSLCVEKVCFQKFMGLMQKGYKVSMTGPELRIATQNPMPYRRPDDQPPGKIYLLSDAGVPEALKGTDFSVTNDDMQKARRFIKAGVKLSVGLTEDYPNISELKSTVPYGQIGHSSGIGSVASISTVMKVN